MYGRKVLNPNSGYPVQVLVDAAFARWKPGGITIDWTTVAALGADLTLNSGLTVKAGQKMLRYGQVMVQITNAPTYTVTLNTTPTGGSFTLTLTRSDGQGQVTTGSIAYNATAAAVQSAIDAVLEPGSNTTTGSAGGPYTVAFNQFQPTPTATSALTGGSPNTVTIAVSAANANFGYYGPFDSAASDGRQTLARSACGILNETIVQNGVLGFTTLDTDHAGVLQGGLLYKKRILATTGTHSLAAGPTFTELEAALPLVEYAGEFI